MIDYAKICKMGDDRINNNNEVCRHKKQENRNKGHNRLLDSPKVQKKQQTNPEHGKPNFIIDKADRKKAENGIRTAGN